MKTFWIAVAVIVGLGAAVYAGLVGYAFWDWARCTSSIDHHPAADTLRRDLDRVVGVTSADVAYTEYRHQDDPECGSAFDGTTVQVEVALDADAPASSWVAVVDATSAVLQEHPDWGGGLTLRAGDDRVAVSDPDASRSSVDVASTVAVVQRIRELGTARVALRFGPGAPGVAVQLELPGGSDAEDLRPAYADLRAAGRTEQGTIPVKVHDLVAADGSGFDTVGGRRVTRAEWIEQQRLSAISLPGAGIGVHLRGTGNVDLNITSHDGTAHLEDPVFRARLTAVVHREVLTFRGRVGFSPTYRVRLDGKDVAAVDTDVCRRGLTSWDAELNRWYWAVDSADACQADTPLSDPF